MPDRNTVFWQQSTDARRNQWVLQIIPADSTALSSPTYHRIPDVVFFDVSEIKAQYEKRPRGHIEQAALTVKIDARALDLSTAMQDLRTFLVQPQVTAAGSVSLGGSDTLSINTTTRFVLMCDNGAGFDAPDTSGDDDPIDSRFYDNVVFEGAVRMVPSRMYDLSDIPADREWSAAVSIDFVVVHMAKMVLETLPTAALCRRVFNVRDAENDGSLQRICFDLLWHEDGFSYVRGTYGAADFAAFYRVRYLFDEMVILGESIFRAFRRDSTSNFDTAAKVGSTINFNATPFHHITFRKQNYDSDGQPGDNITVYDGDVLFLGAVHPTSTAGALDDCLGGLLVDMGKESKLSIPSAFTNTWDFLTATCIATGCKMQLPSTQAGTLQIWFSKIKQNTQSGTRTIPIAKMQRAAKIEEPGPIISSVKMAIPGLEGADLSQATSQTTWGGIEADDDENVRALWHMSPRLGDEKVQTHWYNVGPIETSDQIAVMSHDYLAIIGDAPHSYWRLYYWEQAVKGATNLTTVPVALGVHPFCTVDYGGTLSTSSGGPFALPVIGGGDFDEAKRLWWELLQGVLLDIHTNMGLPLTVAEMYATVFGHPGMVQYSEVGLPMGVVIPAWMGEVFTLGDGTASTFLKTGETWLNHLSTQGILTAISVTKESGLCTCTFLHVYG